MDACHFDTIPVRMTGTPGASYFVMNSSFDRSSEERRSTLVRSNQCGLIVDKKVRRVFDFVVDVVGRGRLERLGWDSREVIDLVTVCSGTGMNGAALAVPAT